MNRPVISIAFANRNDGYGGDQERRFHRFIDYYEQFARAFPGVLEFMICDWNPPSNRPALRDGYPWERLGLVRHLVVDAETHASFETKRKILDYYARNACVRRASAPWSLILNQDIFVTSEILRYLLSVDLPEQYFLRGDRLDFEVSRRFWSCPADCIEQEARRALKTRHRRLQWTSDTQSMSVPVSEDTYTASSSFAAPWEAFDRTTGIAAATHHELMELAVVKECRSMLSEPYNVRISDARFMGLYGQLGLHTNASGDFLVAPTRSFHDIHGFPETTKFYMHSDSYGLVQLFASGLGQMVFTGTQGALHANHAVTDHMASEQMTWAEHARVLSEIALGAAPYTLNDADWGLGSMSIEV